MPFIFFWPAIVLAAWFGGYGPGVFALASSAAAAALTGRGGAVVGDLLSFASFAGGGYILVGAIEAMHRANARAGAQLDAGRQSHDALQESLRAKEEVLDGIRTIFIALDREFRIRYVNRAGLAHFGKSPAELSGRSLWDLSPESRGGAEEAALRRVLSEDAPVQFETEHLARGNWCEVLAFPSDGGLTLLVTDVTDRRRSREALRATEELLRLTAEQVPAILWTTDDRLVITSSLGAGLAGIGLKPGQLVGTGLASFVGEDDPAVAAHRKALREGVSARYEGTYGGRPFESHIEPLRDGGGRIVGLVGVGLDLSERKRAEDALRASEECLAAELASARLLQEISTRMIGENSPETLYEQVLDAATAIMRSDFASLQMYHPDRGDSGELQLLAHRSFTPEASRRWEWVQASSDTTCGIALRTRTRVTVPDLEKFDFTAGSGEPEAYAQTGIRAVQSTPLLSRNGTFLGMISTHWRTPHAPTPSELGLFDVLARQAADLIERSFARKERAQREAELEALKEQLARQVSDLEVLHGLSARLPSSLDLDEVLREVLAAAVELQGARMGFVELADPAGGGLVVAASVGHRPEAAAKIGRIPIAEGAGACGTAAARRASVVVEDVEADPVFARYRHFAAWAGFRAVWSWPLLGRRGELLGVLAIHHGRPRAPSPREARLVDLYSRYASSAIEGAQLYRRAQDEVAVRLAKEAEVLRLNDDLERRVRERTAALEGMVRELDTFAYTVAHDLRTPIRAMQGLSHILLEDHAPRLGDDGRNLAERIARAGERMDALIRDLLAYSRLSREDVALAPVDLGRLVEDAVRECEPEAAARGAELRVEGPLPAVLGHEVTLRQAVTNLLSNALKFTAPGVRPRVRVGAERDHDRVRLWVEDNGIGIASEDQSRIFRVFERLHPGDRYPGTGIGLAIVRRALERMGGATGLASEPGRGSRFWIELGTAPPRNSAEEARP
jgi:PAS domain S-box-containing protein